MEIVSLFYTLAAFVVALSIIVAVHEYGHYIVGRWCGIHAEVFSLGFGPILYSRVDRHGTQWQVAAIPFGGYVKFLGDADAASGKDGEYFQKMDPSGIERTMHGAKLWKRSATVAAGPVFNFILSMIIFAGIALFQGQATERPTIGELRTVPESLGAVNLLPGDVLLEVEGQATPDYTTLYEIVDAVQPPGRLNYLIERNDQTFEVEGPFALPPIVGALSLQSAAIDSALREGDWIMEIDGQPIVAFAELREAVAGGEGAELELTVWRDGETFTVPLQPKRTDLPSADGGFESRWLIGVAPGLLFDPAVQPMGLFASIGYGAEQTFAVMQNSIQGLFHIITGAISSCNLQGPIGIAEISGQAASQGLGNFIWIIAVLSTAVGLINLFPIPVLDGGHLVFHAYEAVSGHPPSDKMLKVMMSAGLAVILSFMLFALSNDLFCP
ncbi:MAG: RIP metalloprotease RseP [Pseudomonadota bacterium]